ncbi:hypothetical protein GCM10007363_28320 [Pseudomonas fluvialis]|uniref:Uncharacterized protein n=1 Tax=Pseudomonas fluvialis TaxID=1793966 RepID=A0ABQ2AUC6_9PSED|nr:hypothetical protein GCM10007363_28320 [Pseudomonas fluvialis]
MDFADLLLQGDLRGEFGIILQGQQAADPALHGRLQALLDLVVGKELPCVGITAHLCVEVFCEVGAVLAGQLGNTLAESGRMTLQKQLPVLAEALLGVGHGRFGVLVPWPPA